MHLNRENKFIFLTPFKTFFNINSLIYDTYFSENKTSYHVTVGYMHCNTKLSEIIT